jgi:hypothetical protein
MRMNAKMIFVGYIPSRRMMKKRQRWKNEIEDLLILK